MAKELPQLEQSDLTKYIPPKGEYEKFIDMDHFLQKTREWGLNTNTSKKTEFWYKEKFYKRKVTIKGYEVHGTYNTFIIEFMDGNLMCISPLYLKEMQSSSFGEEVKSEEELEEKVKKQKEDKKEKPKEEKKGKVKEEKIEIPEGKVKLTMTVEKFDTVYNSFAERDEIVILYQDVNINDGEIKLDKIWSSMSKTLESLELKEGDKIQCEGKVVPKKLKKEAEYKLNNPSKIEVNN